MALLVVPWGGLLFLYADLADHLSLSPSDLVAGDRVESLCWSFGALLGCTLLWVRGLFAWHPPSQRAVVEIGASGESDQSETDKESVTDEDQTSSSDGTESSVQLSELEEGPWDEEFVLVTSQDGAATGSASSALADLGLVAGGA